MRNYAEILVALLALTLGGCAERMTTGRQEMPAPRRVTIDGIGFTNVLARAGANWSWRGNGVSVQIARSGEVTIWARETRLLSVRLDWTMKIPSGSRFFMDAWERTNGDSGWYAESEFRGSPWFTMVNSPDGRTEGFGVEVHPKALAYWKRTADGLALELDVSAGGQPLNLGNRELKAARIVRCKGEEGEEVFDTGRRFCRLMCPTTKLAKTPVYGYNDWYSAYGKNTATNFLADAAWICSLAEGLENRPYVVMDDGWQPNSPPVVGAFNPSAAGGSGYGPWNRSGAAFGMEMGEFAAKVRALGANPGLWYRPYRTWPGVNPRLATKYDERFFDPTLPQVKEMIRNDITRFREWGFKLVKIDYLTRDVCKLFGGKMGDRVFHEDCGWQDNRRTSAEVLMDHLLAMREAAGDDVVLIGCNALNHLVAGVFEVQRTGDDTSGWKWEQTYRQGVNTLATRSMQDGIFFAADADCVGLAKAGAIDWAKNRQWLDLVSRSGTPLFISWQRSLMNEETNAAFRKAFCNAAEPWGTAVPVDWLENRHPRKWQFGDGTTTTYEW